RSERRDRYDRRRRRGERLRGSGADGCLRSGGRQGRRDVALAERPRGRADLLSGRRRARLSGALSDRPARTVDRVRRDRVRQGLLPSTVPPGPSSGCGRWRPRQPSACASRAGDLLPRARRRAPAAGRRGRRAALAARTSAVRDRLRRRDRDAARRVRATRPGGYGAGRPRQPPKQSPAAARAGPDGLRRAQGARVAHGARGTADRAGPRAAAARRRVVRRSVAGAPADRQRPVSGALYVDLDGTLLGRGASLMHDGEGHVTLLGGRRRAQVAEDARLLGQRAFIYEAGCVLELDGEQLWMTELVAGERSVYQQIEDSGAPALLLEHYAGRLEYHDPWHRGREISHLFRGLIDAAEADALLGEHGHGNLRLVDNGGVSGPARENLRAYHLI